MGLIAQLNNPVLRPNISSLHGWAYFQSLLPTIVGIALLAGVTIFFFIFLWGAIQWITAGGDQNTLAAAKSKITHAIIGLLILLLVFVAVQLVNRFFGINIGRIGTGPSVSGLPTLPPTIAPPTGQPAGATCVSIGGYCYASNNNCGFNAQQANGTCPNAGEICCVLNSPTCVEQGGTCLNHSCSFGQPHGSGSCPPGNFCCLPFPTPTTAPVSCPLPPSGLNPSGTLTCGTTSVNLTWNSDPLATGGYALRVDDETAPGGWSGNCNDPNPPNQGDYCLNVQSNSYTINVTPGHSYRWWVHSIDGASCPWSNPTQVNFTDPSCVIPIPIPSFTPVPTISIPTATPTSVPPLATPTPTPMIIAIISPTISSIPPTPTPAPTCAGLGISCDLYGGCCPGFYCNFLNQCHSASNIFLNSRLNMSCRNMCLFYGYSGCLSIGTDLAASNGLVSAVSSTSPVCFESTTFDCNQVIYYMGPVCTSAGNTFEANWTNCYCI